MKDNKAPDEGDIIIEMVKFGGGTVMKELKEILIINAQKRETPESWGPALVILIHKKEDRANFEDHRPIFLLSQQYNLFTKIFSTCDHHLTRKF